MLFDGRADSTARGFMLAQPAGQSVHRPVTMHGVAMRACRRSHDVGGLAYAGCAPLVGGATIAPAHDPAIRGEAHLTCGRRVDSDASRLPTSCSRGSTPGCVHGQVEGAQQGPAVGLGLRAGSSSARWRRRSVRPASPSRVRGVAAVRPMVRLPAAAPAGPSGAHPRPPRALAHHQAVARQRGICPHARGSPGCGRAVGQGVAEDAFES